MYRQQWPQREIAEAMCSQTGHKPAEKHCGCGFWAKWDILGAHQYYYSSLDGVLGAFLGWGKVQRHSDEGFRCQYGQVIGFLKPAHNIEITSTLTYKVNSRVDVIKRLAELYDVPMLESDELTKFALSQGITYNQLKDKK